MPAVKKQLWYVTKNARDLYSSTALAPSSEGAKGCYTNSKIKTRKLIKLTGSFFYLPSQIISRLMSLSEAAPHMVIVDLSSPTSLSM